MIIFHPNSGWHSHYADILFDGELVDLERMEEYVLLDLLTDAPPWVQRRIKEELCMRKTGKFYDAEIFAELEPFKLKNDSPAPAECENKGGKQGKLFAGLDCLRGQQDLFPTDG